MSDYILGRVTGQSMRVSSSKRPSKHNPTQDFENGDAKVSSKETATSDFTSSSATGENLAGSISTVLDDLSKVNNNTRETENFNLDINQREGFKKSVGSLLDDLEKLINSGEFNEVEKQLGALNLKLNINSPKEKEFLKNFSETQINNSKPDLMGIFDHISNLQDLVNQNFALNQKHIVTQAKSKDEEESPSLVLLDKETSQLKQEIDLGTLQDQFLKFGSKTLQVQDQQLLIGINGIKADPESPKKLHAAYLLNLDSGEVESSFSHPDFKDSKTFKGAKLNGDYVSINSNGSEYVFSKDGEFKSKLTAPGSNNRISEGEIIGDKFYAIAAATEKQDGRVVGGLFKFDLNTGELLDEIKKPSQDPSATFGSNIKQGSHGRLFISENIQKNTSDGVTSSGRIHIFNTDSNKFEEVLNSEEDVPGLGHFGNNLTVNDRYVAVSSSRKDGEEVVGSKVHVFDLRRNEQAYSIKMEDFGAKLDGQIALDGDNLLVSSVTQGGRSNIYEFDLSTRDKNLEKFTQILQEDLNTLSTVKDSVVVDRLKTDNDETKAVDQSNFVGETNREKVSKFIEHLGHSFSEDKNKGELFGVQTNAVGSKVLDLLP